MKLNSRLTDAIGRYRLYFDRARWYLATGQTVLLIIIALSSYGIKITIPEMILLFFITLFTFIVIGYVDVKLGFLKAEQKKYNSENEAIQEILKILKDKN